MTLQSKISRLGIPIGASLPEEIITDILTRLPVKSLLRLRCVCKTWYRLFKTTNFAKLQLDYSWKNRSNDVLIDSVEKISYLDYDSLFLSDLSTLYNKIATIAYPLEYEKNEIVGSCNGLVCYVSSEEDIIIWNPLTKDYKKIPTAPEPAELPRYGFGYDSKTDDYKLVVYGYEMAGPLVTVCACIHVYSLKLNSWSTITNMPIDESPGNIVFFRGFFHWVDGRYSPGPKDVACFDIANETVKHILLPRNFHTNHRKENFYEAPKPCLLGGRFCVIGKHDKKKITEVWTMKDYGVAESWTKIFTIDEGKLVGLQRLDMKQYFKNDAILVNHEGYSTDLYDLNQEIVREITLPGYDTWDFVGSLVSPNLNN